MLAASIANALLKLAEAEDPSPFPASAFIRGAAEQDENAESAFLILCSKV